MADQLFIAKIVKNEGISMNYNNIKYEETNKIATITLNRPKYLNALCDELMHEIGLALDDISQNDRIHVVILKGNDKAFAAGADISQMKDLDYIAHIKEDFIKPWEKISGAPY